jgi:hypothetical protein
MTMRFLIQAATAAVAVAVPAFAQDAPLDPAAMTCADFTAMDSEGQMQAMVALQSAMTGQVTGDVTDEAADEAMMAEDATEGAADAATTDTTTDTATADAATDTATADTATADAATADTATADATAADGATAGDDPMMAAMMTACEGSPDMMATDAMMQAQGG